jgi:hypothetical protein
MKESKIKIYKNFLNQKDCYDLFQWILTNSNEPFFKNANMNGNRVTTRYSSEEEITYPQLAFEIRNRIKYKLNIKEKGKPEYPYGMVASCAFPGDTCYEHKDPVWVEGTRTVHCNIICSDSEGGYPIVEEEEYKVNKGDMWVYDVSKYNHGSSELKMGVPRTMWIFGFCIE